MSSHFARRGPEHEPDDLVLEVVGHELATVIMADAEADILPKMIVERREYRLIATGPPPRSRRLGRG